MTIYSGVNYAKTQATPITQLEEGQYNSPTLHILDQFVLTADLAANDTILVGGVIPEGAVILDARVATGALGGSAALNFGIQAGTTQPVGSNTPQAADASAFFAALPVASATYATAYASTYIGDYYTQVPYTSNVQAVIACTVATSGASGKSIFVDIWYTKDGG